MTSWQVLRDHQTQSEGKLALPADALTWLAEEVTKAGSAALVASFERFVLLGEEGKEKVQKNQFGESALRMDVEAEAEVIRVLRDAKLPVRIYSEEHGVVDLVEHPILIATLDGIDGTKEYKEDRINGKYGTLLSIYLGDSPTYDDYLFSGMMIHSEGRLYKVTRNSTPVVEFPASTEAHGNLPLPVTLSERSALTQGRIFVDEYFEINKLTFSAPLVAFRPKCTMSSTRYYAALAAGTADVVGECTRKGNLEIAAAYPIVTAAGGYFVTLNGKSLGQLKFLEFGQKRNEHNPVIAAANIAVLRETLDIMRAYGIIGVGKV